MMSPAQNDISGDGRSFSSVDEVSDEWVTEKSSLVTSEYEPLVPCTRHSCRAIECGGDPPGTLAATFHSMMLPLQLNFMSGAIY